MISTLGSPPLRNNATADNVKDGHGFHRDTYLFTYYEEGPGSNIHVKRFVTTPDGIEFRLLIPMDTPGRGTIVLSGFLATLDDGDTRHDSDQR